MSFLDSVFSTEELSVDFTGFILCIITALILGLFIAYVHTLQKNCSKNYIVTLAIIPIVVTMVIMMVNGNVGTGVAVAGAFSLIRFRSQPGSAKEIGGIFIAMASGIATGMGYIGLAIIFTIIVTLFEYFLTNANFTQIEDNSKILNITIPEDLNYSHIFDDLLKKFTKNSKIISVRTTNMGTMYKLKYNIKFKDNINEKEFIDEIRCRNGNLEVAILEHVIEGQL